MLGSRGLVGLAALVVVATTLAVTLTGNGGEPTELLGKEAQMLAQNEQKLESAEMLAARAQDRLLLKDKRIFNSLNLAARKQALSAEDEDEKFLQARNTQLVLDQRLSQLTETLRAQEQALAYMGPKLQERMRSTELLGSLVQQLDGVVPQIPKDLKHISEKLQNIADAGKQAKEQIRTADEELVKNKNAYNLFGKRMATARQEAAQSRSEVEDYNVEALRAQQAATALRQHANEAKSMQEGQMLAAEARREEARVAMLNKESAEAMQSTQLHDAEADEATSYMSMFGADAQQAEQRLAVESQKLQALAREYHRGKYLELSGKAREKYLKGELARAQQELQHSAAKAQDDKLAFQTGEKATARTADEVHIEEQAAMGNTQRAARDVREVQADRERWESDSAQAEAIKLAAREHEHAAVHLEKAASLDQ